MSNGKTKFGAAELLENALRGIRACLRCGKTFEAGSRSRAEYCSRACRQAAYRKRKKERTMDTALVNIEIERLRHRVKELERIAFLADGFLAGFPGAEAALKAALDHKRKERAAKSFQAKAPPSVTPVNRVNPDHRCQHRTIAGDRCKMAGKEYVTHRDHDGILARYLACQRHARNFRPWMGKTSRNSR